MACRRTVNKNNLLRWERVYGGLTIAELQVQGIAALCNPADVAPPYNLVATGQLLEIALTWDFEGQNDGFIIYRSTDNVTFTILDAAIASARAYTDTTATVGVLYYYYVVATMIGNESAASNIVSATPLFGFLFTVKSDNTGVTNTDQFRLPIINRVGSANVDVYIDGVFDRTITDASVLANRTLTFAGGAGTYQIIMVNAGTVNWGFNFGEDKDKVLSIEAWGDFSYVRNGSTGLGAAPFYGCSEMTAITATDAPDLSSQTGGGVNTLGLFTRSCTKLTTINNIENWDFSEITTMASWTRNANVLVIPSLANVDFGEVLSLNTAFFTCPLINPDLTGSDFPKCTDYSLAFRNTALNRNLGHFRIAAGMTTGFRMFNSSAMSTENYTDTLVGWANYIFDNGGTPTSVNFGEQNGRTFQNSRSGGANFADAAAARTYLISTLGWTISGDSVIA